jgi:hypothetical protein
MPASDGLTISASWYCLRRDGEPIREIIGGRTYVMDLCGAPVGKRCPCRKVGHDPGDEDVNAP